MNSKRGRNSFTLLSWLMVVAFLVTSLGNIGGVVYAQDIAGETPTPEVLPTSTADPTEVPTEEPTAPLEPTLEMTQEATDSPQALSDGMANLSLTAPEGWDAPLVISTQPGTHTTDTLTDGENEFIDLAVFNSGDAVSTPFNMCLKIDGEEVQCWEVNSLASDEFFTVEDWAYTADRGTGSHYFELTVDGGSAIAETNETDNTWSFDFTWMPSDLSAQSVGSPLIGDTRQMPELPGMHEQSSTGSSAPGYWDNASFMVDSIAVGVILPESAGSYENWTSAEQTQVTNEIQEGLNRWDAWSTTSGEFANKDVANANVSFSYDFRYSIPTTYEPIQLSSEDDCTWINNVMANMGYTNPNGCWYRVYDYLNDLRTSKGTKWATLVFVVDSSTDPDGAFSDGYFGYAYLHGAYIMMTYDNDGWGIGSMDQVIQHEMGHMFGAGDNYYQAGYGGCTSTTQPYGYLGIPNSNCEYNNPSAITDVLMNSNTIDRNHWTAQYQVGWRDSDQDSFPDVVDTTPRFLMTSMSPSLQVSGIIYDQPLTPASTNFNAVTINTIDWAEYSVDSGTWYMINASDGSFDEDYEPVSFNLGAVSNGTHTLDVRVRNTRGVIYTTSTSFTYPKEPPANDLIAYAIPMSLDTTYTSFTAGATINSAADGAALADPVNVCNSEDTGSVWYQFTAPSTGVYTLNTYGSDYEPNLTVVKKVSDTTRTPVVCGRRNFNSGESYKKLSFNAVSGSVYLIGVSDDTGGGSLSLKVQKRDCPSGFLCGAAVGGDGKVINWPTVRFIYSNGWSGWGGEFSGFVQGQPYNHPAGTYKVVTTGDGSLIVNPSVTVPGIYAPSAIGYPRTLVTVKDTTGTEIATDSIAVVSTANNGIGDFLNGSPVGAPLELYAPAGTYNFFASSNAAKTEVYLPGVTIVSSSTPGSVVLDASALPHDTFTFDLDGITDSNVWIYSPDYYGHYQSLTADGAITFAAPAGTEIPWVDYTFYATDASDMQWNYYMELGSYWDEISGGADHAYTVGGALTFSPSILNDPIRLDEGRGEIYPGIRDGHGNAIDSIQYYGYSSSAGLTAESVNDEISSNSPPDTFQTEKGGYITLPEGNTGEISAQDFISQYVSPSYTVTDADGGITVATGNPYCLDCFTQFEIPSTAPTGTWSYEGSIDLGPYGSGVKTASGTFSVYSLSDYPLTNDDFNNAVVISSMPYSIEGINTSGATQASDDPLITALGSKGYASAWFKYVSPYDATLTVDTSGSNYDTVLNVWQGSRGALSNRAYNDDYGGLSSRVELQVNAGQTYYIEVTQYATRYGENLDVQSLEVEPTGKDGMEIQSIGGLLNLHASVVNCYSLSAKPNNATYGSVVVSPAPNCRTTKYTQGTEITLDAVSKPNYGFTGWSDAASADPYVFNIVDNTTLTANFTHMTAPVITSPSQGVLIPSQWPFLIWSGVPVATKYEFQLDRQSTFTLPIDLTNIIPETTIVPTLEDGVWYLRVRSVNDRGEFGPWSTVRSFTIDTVAPNAPVLSTPLDGATTAGVPTFYWQPAPTAVRYQFMYSTSDDPDQPFVYQSGELTTTYHKPTVMPATSMYYWYVRARDAAGNWSPWSTPRGFTVVPPKPLAVVLNTPASGFQTNDTTPELTWKYTLYAVKYEIQVDDSSLFNEPLIQSHTVETDGITGLSRVLDTLTEEKVYYWRVRALNANDEPGPWSAYRSFKTDYTAPLTPVLKTPIDGARPVGTPTFYWTASLTAVRYQFEYSTNPADPENTFDYRSAELATTYFKPPTMTLMTQYYWFVRAKDAAGNWSPWSAPFAVTSVPPKPATVVLDTPASGYLTSNQTPELKWKNTLYAVKYEIQVDDSYLFTAPLVQSANDIVALSHVLDTLNDGKYYWRVRAMNENGDYGSWSAYRYFTIDTTPPAIPVLSTPLDGAKPVGTPTFYWKSSLTAVRYQFMYSTSSDPNQPYVYQSGELATTYHKPPAMELMQWFYWFVRAKDAAGNWSDWTAAPFEVMVVPPAPPAVVLDTPALGYITNVYQPEFKWKTAAYAVSYQLQLDESSTFTDPIMQDYVGIEGLSKVSAIGLDSGKYYWRVRAWNSNNVPGPWSTPRYFTVDHEAPAVPVLSLPLNGARTVGTPTFSWKAVTGATRYQFMYSLSDADGDPYVYQSGELTTTTHKPPTMALMTDYYWFVRAKDAAGNWSNWSAPFNVMVVPPAPPAVTLDSPASGYLTNDNTPVLYWKSTLYARDYELQVDDSYTFSSPVLDQQLISGLSKTLTTPLADGKYYWRVRAENDNATYGPWSAYRYFTIDTTAPASPALVSPVNNAGTSSFKPPLTVTAVSGANRYRFQVATQDTFAYPIRDTTQTGTIYTTPVALTYGDYYWRVKAIDAAGNESDWSSTRRFTVTLMKTPGNNAVLDDSTPTFTWNAVTGALEYQLNVSSTDDFSTLYLDRSLSGSTSFTPVDEMPNGSYYWRLRYRTTAGWSTWQPTWVFTVNSSVLNGSFESGSAYWSEYSSNDWALIVNALPMAPRGGSYAAWLGGDYNEYSELSQSNIHMNSGRYLHYWYWSNSSDICGYDFAYVVVNGSVKKTYNLCSGTNTGGWSHQVIDLQSYTGSTINLTFIVDTDSSLISNFYLDNISINNSSTTGTLNSISNTEVMSLDGVPEKKAP